jgi:hypothetical protein
LPRAASPEPLQAAASPEPLQAAASPEPLQAAASPEPLQAAASPEPLLWANSSFVVCFLTVSEIAQNHFNFRRTTSRYFACAALTAENFQKIEAIF